MLSPRKCRLVLGLLVAGFVLANGVAFIHAYTFTHFSDASVKRTDDPERLSGFSKVKLLFTGIDNPRPANKAFPDWGYDIVTVNSSGKLACWSHRLPESEGTVILFHGYAGEKSSLLRRANEFIAIGYSVFMVDFLGAGGSEGNSTSVGYTEAAQVRACMNYVSSTGETNIILFGTSMGSAAILKALDDFDLQPKAIVLECPFGSLYKTVCARFGMMGVPSFPMAALLCVWGGAQHGYWAFSHNPSAYAGGVSCPTLLLYGRQDERVTLQETENIYNNLKGTKTLKVYPEAGHDVFIPSNRAMWIDDVSDFVRDLPK